MIIVTHKRCGRRIQDEEGVVTEHPSINAAKRASRKLGLGRIVTVENLHNIKRVLQVGLPRTSETT